MKKIILAKLILIIFLAYEPALAENYDHSSDDWQIKAYSSAAPSFIGKYASILGGNGKVIRKGSNGWTCQSGNPRPFPENGWKNYHEAMPTCHDAQAMKWMMAYSSGTKPKLDKDGWMWMLHGDVGEDNLVPMVLNKKDSTPGEWIESGPHLMLMPKDPSALNNYSTDFTTGAPYVMFPGTDYAHVMIPSEGYYHYQEESEPKK